VRQRLPRGHGELRQGVPQSGGRPCLKRGRTYARTCARFWYPLQLHDLRMRQ
jgi:hypothetical protein